MLTVGVLVSFTVKQAISKIIIRGKKITQISLVAEFWRRTNDKIEE